MNLGNGQSGSALRRGWPRQVSAMGLAVVVGVFGFVGVHHTERRAEAAEGNGAEAVEAALDWPAGADPAVDLPIPPRLLVTPEAEPVTPTTLPAETTATAPPPDTTTTTLPPAPPPTTPPKPVVRVSAGSGEATRAQVEAIADSSGWNWRAAGVRFNLGFHPSGRNWGVYEAATSVIWIGPTAFGDPNRLRYVVLHELAHAWQYRQNRFAHFIRDYAAWGFDTIGPALEAGADCVANVWGAAGGHYWRCPADARALALRRLGGDWR